MHFDLGLHQWFVLRIDQFYISYLAEVKPLVKTAINKVKFKPGDVSGEVSVTVGMGIYFFLYSFTGIFLKTAADDRIILCKTLYMHDEHKQQPHEAIYFNRTIHCMYHYGQN